MGRRRLLLAVAAVAALSLVLASCGGDEDEVTPGAQEAAACTAGRLKEATGGALGAGALGAKLVAAKEVAQAKPTIKIGFFGDITGANSGLVLPPRDGAALAIEQRNEKGDLQVRVVFVPRDNKDANPDTAPPIERAFIADDEVVGVIGGVFSGETAAVGELFDRAGLAHVTPSATSPDLTKNGWPFFRAVVTDDIQGAKIAQVLAALGCKKVAVIDDKGQYGKGLADFVASRLRELNVEVVVREGIAAGTKDYGPLVDTIAARDPDAVFYGGYYQDGSLILKQLRERGLDATFTCGDGCADRQMIELAGAANAEGAIFTCPCTLPVFATTPEAAQLQREFKAKYDKDALIYSAEGYDAANIFLEAIAASDDDGRVTRQEVLKFIQDLEGFKGVSRTYTFDARGELSEEARTINVYPVASGSLKLIGTTEEVAPS